MFRDLTDIARTYLISEKNFKESSSYIEKRVSRALSRMSHYARTNVRYYADLFTNLGLESGLSGISDLQKLPVIDRKHVVDAGRDMMCASISGDLSWRRTSGTSGEPLRIPWSREQLNAVIAMRLRFSRRMGLRPWNSTVWIHYTGKPKNGDADDFYEAYGRRSPSIMWSNPSKFPGSGKRIKSLESFSPDLIASWPSDLVRTGRAFADRGRSVRSRIVLPMGEVLTKSRREELAELWQGDVFEVYGMSEFGTIATECSDHHGLHLASDFFVLEVLNKKGEASSHGQGELVITNLYNKALPLFRYNTHDVVTVSDEEKCSCGTRFPLVTQFSGRYRDGLLRDDGSRVPPGVIMEEIECILERIEYQLTQESLHKFTLAVPGGHLEENVLERVRAMLERFMGDLTLDLSELNEITGRKQRRVISNL